MGCFQQGRRGLVTQRATSGDMARMFVQSLRQNFPEWQPVYSSAFLLHGIMVWQCGVCTGWEKHWVFLRHVWKWETVLFFFSKVCLWQHSSWNTKNTWFRLRKRSFLYVYKGFRMFNSNYVHKNVTTSKQTKSNNGGLITWHTGVCYLCGAKRF